MKLQALCLVTFLSIFIGIKSDRPEPSFLRFIGSYKYNTTDDQKVTLKRYYLSQRTFYTWIDAFMVCKSVGMRMAFIETDAERANLAVMGRRSSKLFEYKVFVGGYNLTVTEDQNSNSDAMPCYSVQKGLRRKLEFRTEWCNENVNKFMCEDVVIADTYEDIHNQSGTLFDVKSIFTYIGSFESKKYYASLKLKAHPNNVHKICHSFGMQMATPRNQAEYEAVGNLLVPFTGSWESVAIACYRSEENHQEWVVANNKPNYEMEWSYGEPNNADGGEHCLAIRNNDEVPRLNDISCHADDWFLCEFDESLNNVSMYNQADQSIFLKPLTKIEELRKELFVSLYDVDWITANRVCKNFGMELSAPSSEAEDEILRSKLEGMENVPTTLHFGVTSLGAEDNVWYSASSGKIIDFDLKWSEAEQYESETHRSKMNCLQLRKDSDNFSFSYEEINCFKSPKNRFLCQKVTGSDDISVIEADQSPNTSSTSTDSSILGSTVATLLRHENDIEAIKGDQSPETSTSSAPSITSSPGSTVTTPQENVEIKEVEAEAIIPSKSTVSLVYSILSSPDATTTTEKTDY